MRAPGSISSAPAISTRFAFAPTAESTTSIARWPLRRERSWSTPKRSFRPRASPNGIIGSELVYEHVHLTPQGNYLLARAMFLQIASKLPRRGPRIFTQRRCVPPTFRPQAECEQLLAFTAHDRLRINRRCCNACRSRRSPIN